MSLPVHVINLERVPARWDFVRAQFAAAGMTDAVHRFSAVDARASDFHASGYAPHSWGDRWELTASEQAVFESHRALWRQVCDHHPKGAVICEDDILISGRFGDALAALDLECYGVIKLDGFNAARRYGTAQAMGGWTVRPIVEAVPSAACYALNARAAGMLIEASQSYCATLDDFVFAARPGLAPVQLFPAVAVQGMCCVQGLAGPIPGEIAHSERDAPGTTPKADKGPALYRLAKEGRRALIKARIALGADRRLTAAGGLLAVPQLADDLPDYRHGGRADGPV